MISVLYDLLYLFPLSLVSVLAAGIYMYMPQRSGLPFVLLIVIFATCLYVVHRKSRLRFLLPVILILSAAMAVFIQKGEERSHFVFNNQWVLWVSLAVVGCFFAGKLILFNRWGKRVMAAAIIVTLGICMWQKINVDKAVASLAFLPVLLILTEEVQSRWKKSGYTDGKSHLVGVSPFLILICVLVFISPSSEKPYSWSMFVKIWEKASEGIELTSRFFHSGDEDYIAKTGFNSDGIFTDNVREDSKELIRMTSIKPVGSVVYLVGGVYDNFEGMEWHATHTPDTREHMLDIIETAAAVYGRDPDNVQEYMKKAEVRLYYLDFNTSYTFLPEKSVFAGNKISDIDILCENGSFKSVKPLGYSSDYSVNFFRMNRGSEACSDMLANPLITDEQTWDEVRYNHVPESGYKRVDREVYDTSYASYLEYQDSIYDIYLPETEISDKTGNFLEELFEGADSDYEKLTRIEKLLGEMEYDLDPGRLPEDVTTPAEYLDHLLFNSQKGFCTHYATAFVLLARSQGIPARLVQGFYVTGWDGKNTVVTSAMAHSWAEAYIKGIGWVSFEPTPGKKVVDMWSVNTESGAYKGPSQELSYKPDLEEEPEAVEAEKGSFITKERIALILIPMGTFLILIILFILLEKLLEKRWYRKLGDRDKFRITCRRNLKILGYLGYVRGEGETLSELAGRAAATVDPQALHFVLIYERLIYAGKDPIPDQIRSAEIANRDLLDHLKEEKGKFFFLYRMSIMRPEKIKQ